MPTTEILDGYYDKLLTNFPEHLKTISRKYDLSFAEARDHTYTAVKSLLIEELERQETVLRKG